MSAPTLQACLVETINRYQAEFHDPPKRMRASYDFGRQLVEELKQAMVYETGADAHLGYDEFQYCGVLVKCDLQTSIPTVIAEREYTPKDLDKDEGDLRA